MGTFASNVYRPECFYGVFRYQASMSEFYGNNTNECLFFYFDFSIFSFISFMDVLN